MQKPWETEGDLKLFESHGLKCAIVRHPTIKHLCGYVELPDNHAWRKIENITWDCPADVLPELGCFVVGFDCIHSGDYGPGMQFSQESETNSYKTMLFVENECRKLAEQIKASA